jgi:hypothetical protein
MTYLLLLMYVLFVYVRPQDIGGVLHGIDIPFMDLIISATVGLFAWSLISNRKTLVMAPQNFLVVGFLAAVALSQLTNLYIHGAITGFSDIGKNVVLYFLVANLVDSENRLKMFIWLQILLACFLAYQGIVQHVSGIGGDGLPLLEGRIRYVGIFADPNELALAFVTAMPFVFPYITSRHKIVLRIFSIGILGLLVYGIWLSDSRGGLLSLGVVILIYAYRTFSRPKAIMIGAAAAVILSYFASTRMTNLTIEDESAHGRIVGMARGIWLMRSSIKSYLFGAGYGSFVEQYGWVAHNTVMQVAGETGLVGLFFFLALISTSLTALSAVSQNSSEATTSLKPVATSLMVSVAGFLVGTLFLSRAYQTPLYILLGSCVALSAIAKQQDPTILNVMTPNHFGGLIVAEGIIIALIYIIVKVYF